MWPPMPGSLGERAGDDYRLAHGPPRSGRRERSDRHRQRDDRSDALAGRGGLGGAPVPARAPPARLQRLLHRAGRRPALVDPDAPRYCEQVMERFGFETGGRCFRRTAPTRSECGGRELRVGRAARPTLLLNVAGMLSDADVARPRSRCAPTSTSIRSSRSSGTPPRASTCASTRHTHFVTVADAIGGPGIRDPELRPRLDADAAAGRAGAVAGRDRPRAPRAHHGRALAKLRLDPPRRRPVRPEGPLAAPADRPARAERPAASSSRSPSIPTRPRTSRR